ncbi:MAG: hypothetical protein ACP5PQ_04955 [Thermoproteota archaeon]
MSDMITVRIPKKLKRRMKASRINWSEAIRRFIKKRIVFEERKRSIEKAVKTMDEIRNRLIHSYGPTSYDSIEVIKLWRSLRK